MDVFLLVLQPVLPLFYLVFAVALLYGCFRLYQIKQLKNQAGTKHVEGIAGRSLTNENFKIGKGAREKGIEGEEGVGLRLEELADEFGLVVLHDLSIAGSNANIDHVLIQQKAVFVIDAKNFQGVVNIKKDSQGVLQLYVGSNKRTVLADKLKSYADKIEQHLASEGVAVEVVPLLAFYKAKFHQDSKYKINGVMVNVSGIKNELMRFAVRKNPAIDTQLVSRLILEEFPTKN